jgi:hypothetical protein
VQTSYGTDAPEKSMWRVRDRFQIAYPVNRRKVTDDHAAYVTSDIELFFPIDGSANAGEPQTRPHWSRRVMSSICASSAYSEHCSTGLLQSMLRPTARRPVRHQLADMSWMLTGGGYRRQMIVPLLPVNWGRQVACSMGCLMEAA